MDEIKRKGNTTTNRPWTRKKRNRRPTIKMIKALQLKSQGLSTRAAMIEAGYSVKQANKSNSLLFKKRGVMIALSNMTKFLDMAGLTEIKMAGKIAEFVDAKKIDHSHTEPDREVPDYRTQIEGVKLWHELTSKEQAPAGKKKREMTVTEWITGDEDA